MRTAAAVATFAQDVDGRLWVRVANAVGAITREGQSIPSKTLGNPGDVRCMEKCSWETWSITFSLGF